MGIYRVGVIARGFAPIIYSLVSTRAIQGIRIAIFLIAFGTIRDQFTREEVSIAQGTITYMFVTGSVIGLSIGGIIIQIFDGAQHFLL